jgi:hypothetical protein
MKSFTHNGQHFDLLHINEDDSRIVVDEDGTELMKFDSSLNILGNDGEHVGRLGAYDNQWHLIKADGSEHPLNIPCNDYGWREMVDAEVEAAKLLLG